MPFFQVLSNAGGDGGVLNDDSTSWANCHDATIGDSVDNTSGFGPYIESSEWGAPTWRISRGFVTFDISSLPTNVRILKANIWIYFSASTNEDNDGQDYIGLYASTQASATNLITDDFDAVGTTLLSNDTFDLTGWTQDFHNFNLNNNGLTQIENAFGSYVKFSMREGHDVENVSIADNTSNNVQWLTRDYNDPNYDPLLEIYYKTKAQIILI